LPEEFRLGDHGFLELIEQNELVNTWMFAYAPVVPTSSVSASGVVDLGRGRGCRKTPVRGRAW
jgi:hypothetical protein